jgi:hypothetical protein
MNKRRTIAAVLAVVAFVGLLLYGTLSSQRTECAVVVDFGGGRDSAVASAATEPDAAREAQSTACGTLAHGMNDRIACGRVPPVTRRCRSLS